MPTDAHGTRVRIVRFLFSDQMARAIVEGRKTVTRRLVTPNANQRWWLKSASQITACPSARMLDLTGSSAAAFDHPGGGPYAVIEAPCAPGDLLIGRECWRVFGGISDVRVDYRADGGRMLIGRESDMVAGAHVHYLPDVSKYEAGGNRWRPSIHMPDWAARIRRRVLSVTVERVQDITEEDAVREGFSVGEEYEVFGASTRFSAVWNSIYAEKGLGWHTNPWVWHIEFGAENVGVDTERAG